MPVSTVPIQVMGILNVTPDSFSDGGQFHRLDMALRHAEAMVAAGADWIDVGGESTRPGAPDVALDDELKRVIPVIERLRAELNVQVSIDTSKAQVMTAAVAAGAAMINDVRALREEGALEAAAATQAQICLMHMQGKPRNMQDNPIYEDVVNEVKQFFESRIRDCERVGIERQRLILDPGFGFGKSMRHNYELLQRLQAFQEFRLPVLAGISRKSMLGHVTGRAVDERLAASLAAAVIAALKGAQIIRVHDVAETVDALKVVTATLTGEC
ncbi:MAG: dihydropteroate synthase [Idiomarina sp.]|nr:dihydropteroate synthase [Idiomarina sp.]